MKTRKKKRHFKGYRLQKGYTSTKVICNRTNCFYFNPLYIKVTDKQIILIINYIEMKNSISKYIISDVIYFFLLFFFQGKFCAFFSVYL